MLKGELIHPEILRYLSLCGHGSKVLLADANYPLAEKTGDAPKVYLGVSPGLPTVTDVLKAIHSVCEIEKAEVMLPEEGDEPSIFAEFRRELKDVPLDGLGRYAYYDACMEPGRVALAVATGEKRTFANLLLTIGCA